METRKRFKIIIELDPTSPVNPDSYGRNERLDAFRLEASFSEDRLMKVLALIPELKIS